MARNRKRHPKDQDAADLVRKLMTAQGLSPDRLEQAIKAKGVKAGYPPARVKVSGDTLRLMFSTGREPGPRIKFAIALYFDLEIGQIWERDSFADFQPARAEVAA